MRGDQLPPVPSIKFGGVDAPAQWYDGLLEMRVDLALRAAGRGTLRFHDPDLSLVTSSKAAIGTEVTLAARRPGQSADEVLLAGKITGISVDQGMRRDPEIVLVVDDAAHSMGRGTHITTYLRQSADDIVSMIAGRYGLSADVRDPSGASRRRIDYLMQADSDFDMLDALCERTGCDWWVEDKKLRFWGPVTSGSAEVEVELGEDLIELSVRASGEHPDHVEVHAWDRIKQQALVATAPAKDARRVSTVELFTKYKSPGGGLGSQTLMSSETPVLSLEEATDLARALRDDAVESGLTATGTVLSGVLIRPGVLLSVVAPTPVTGKYHVTAVEHVFRDRFLTRFTAGDRRRRSLADTLGATGRRDQGLRHSGLVVGRVTNSNDPDKAGKVKVTFVARADQEESNWARVLCLGAGKNRGLVVLPEVGDEVLVGFESSDLRQPVVLGGLFGSKSTMPRVKTEKDVEARSLTSRLGHVVEVKDGTAPADQHVLLRLAGDETHELRIAKDKVDLIVPDGVPLSLKVGAQSSLVFDGNGSLTIKAVNITMEAKGNITTTSNGATKIESNATLDVVGQMTTVKANATLQVQSSGPATIKGTPVAIN